MTVKERAKFFYALSTADFSLLFGLPRAVTYPNPIDREREGERLFRRMYGLEDPPSTYISQRETTSRAHLTQDDIIITELKQGKQDRFKAWLQEQRKLQNTDQITLEGLNLSNANLRMLNLHNIDFSNCILFRADLTNFILERSNFNGACLVDADMSGTRMNQASLYGTDVRNARFLGAQIDNVLFSQSNPIITNDGNSLIASQAIKYSVDRIKVVSTSMTEVYDALERENPKPETEQARSI
jgi:hypothetical protein